MNKNIIIVILVIIILAVVGLFVLQPQTTTDGKLNTQINFLSGDSLKNGDTVQFELKDATGAAIPGASVKILYLHDGQTETYSIMTDSQGKGYLVINGEDAGSYDVTVDYAGNEKYNACSATKTITITDETPDETATQEETESNATANTVEYNQGTSSSQQSSDSSSSYDPNKQVVSQLYYDEELDVYYDDFGTIHGGEYDGDEIYLLRTNSSTLRYPDGYSDLE